MPQKATEMFLVCVEFSVSELARGTRLLMLNASPLSRSILPVHSCKVSLKITGASYENATVSDPTRPDSVVERPALRPVPVGTMHLTLDSDFHGVDRHEVRPARSLAV